MKKLLFLIFISGVIYGQAKNTTPDSASVALDSVRALSPRSLSNLDSVTALSTRSLTNTDSVSSLSTRSLANTDSVSSLSIRSLANSDSVTALSVRSLANIDSLAKHLDTLQSHNSRLNALVDSNTAQRSDINNIVTVSNVGGAIQDSIYAQLVPMGGSVNYPTSSENRGLMRAPYDIQLDSAYAVLKTDGGSNDSIKINIQWGTSRATAGSEMFYGDAWVSSTTTGTALTSDIYDNLIDQGSWIWFVTTSKVGTITDITFTVTYHRR